MIILGAVKMKETGRIRPIKMAKDISTAFAAQFGLSKSRSLQIARASCVGNMLIGIGKLLMGILSFSFFTCVSAFYTFGTVVAKSCALAGLIQDNDRNTQYRYYRLSGIVLIAASILYIIYSIRLFFFPVTTSFHPYLAMGIATFTFTELAVNIRGVIVERHNRTPLFHAIKMINLASSMICLVLTQTAILSFASEHIEEHSRANGTIGIIMGAAATVLGIIMIVRITQIQNNKCYGAAYRKVKKQMRQMRLKIKMKPLRYIEMEGDAAKLYVRLRKPEDQKNFERLAERVYEKLLIDLINDEYRLEEKR